MPGQLHGYWDMQTLENDLLVDFSGHSNDLTKQNSGQSPAPGRMGGAHNFNATLSDRVSVASNNSLDMTDQVTLAFWVYHSRGSSPADITGLIGKALTTTDLQYFVRMTATTRLVEMVWDDGATEDTLQSATALTDRTWYHITCVWDWSNDIQRLYINGVRDNTSTSTRNTHSSAATFSMGRYTDANTANRFLDGYIDEVYLFNRVLTNSEVKELAGNNGQWQVRARKNNIDGWQALSRGVTNFSWEKANKTLGQMSGTVYKLTQEPGDVDSQREGLRFDMVSLTRGGNMKDSSPQNSNDGTIAGTLTAVDGPWGQASDFNNTNNEIIVSDNNSLDATTEISLSAWIQPDSVASGVDHIIFKTGSYRISRSADDIIFGTTVSAGETTTTASTVLTANVWTHVAATYNSDSGDHRIYINGVLNITGTESGSIDSTSSSVGVGSDAAGGSLWDGAIDEVRIYIKELSLREVETLADYHPPEEILLQRLSEISIRDGNQLEWFRGIVEQIDYEENRLKWEVRALGKSQNGIKKKWIGRKNLSSLPPDVLADEVSSSLDGRPPSNLEFYSNMETVSDVLDDDGDDDLEDLSAQGNHGRFSTSQATSVVGKWGRAFDFSGTDQNFVIPDNTSLDIIDNLTLACWFKTDTVVGTQRDIIAKQGAYALVRDGATIQGHTTVSSSNRITTTNSTIVEGRWYHVAFTYDGDNHRIYLDGVLDITDPQTGGLDTTATDLTIGGDDTIPPAAEFDGIIDDVYVYSRTLTTSEIRQLAGREIFSGNFWRPVDGLYRYDMESLSASAMNDFSPNSNDGAITGTTSVDGKHGLARQFGTSAASTDMIDSGVDLDSSTSWTQMAWVRVAASATGETIQNVIGNDSTSSDAQGSLQLVGSAASVPNTYHVLINTATPGFQDISVSFTFVAGTWYHLAATWDGDRVKTFIDGLLYDTTTAGGALVSTALTSIVGHDADPAVHTATFQDRIDDVRVLQNTVLNEAEINFYMNHTEGVFTASDISYRSEEDARILTVDGMANVFDADWGVERDELDNDVVLLLDALGSGPGDPQDTFQLQNDIIDLERRVDSERLFTDITVLGHGDGDNQLVANTFHATNIRTTLSADYLSGVSSAMTVNSTTNFPWSGVVFVGSERVFYVGVSATQIGTDSISRGYTGDGHASPTTYTHEDGSVVFLHVILPENPTTGRQLFYNMETLTGGLMEDLTANTNDGTITGTDDVVGFVNRARDFERDDQDNQISAPDNSTLDASTGLSLVAFINMEEIISTTDNMIIDKELAYRLRVNADGTLQLNTWHSAARQGITSGGTVLDAGRFYHVAGTYQASDGVTRVYVDGVEDNTINEGNNNIDNTANPFTVGTGTGGTGGLFARPDSDIQNPGAWFPTPLWAELDEIIPDAATTAVDTGVQEPPISHAFEVGLSNVADPLSPDNHTIHVQYRNGTGTPRATLDEVSLYEGGQAVGTLIATLTPTNPAESAWQTESYTLSGAEANAITDYTDLSFYLVNTQNDTNDQTFVSWLQFEVPGVNRFDGIIDEVAMYDIVLTPAQIAAMSASAITSLTPETPEANSSIDNDGWTRGAYADRAITNQDSLDRMAANLLEKYREERDSVKIEIYQDVITADLGDHITINDASGRGFRSSPYRIVGLKFSWPFKQWTITLGAQRESAERVIKDTSQQTAIQNTYGRTKQQAGAVESDTTQVSTTGFNDETVIDTITLSSDVREGQRLTIFPTINFITGANTTFVDFAVRRDNLVGAVVQATYRVTVGTGGDRISAAFAVTEDSPRDAPTYVLTAQQTDATANGTAEIYFINVFPSG